MIVVTGTKRSGTSMWMQILKEAGFPVLGRAFPRDWAETIRDANRRGFYESPLRHGIYRATNPNPRTGAFLAPAETARHAVKVFAQGLARTELAYLNYVIASVRDPREYEASLQRLYDMEHQNKLARAARKGRPLTVVPYLSFAPALLEWWHDNLTLLRDAERRGYPIRFVSYAAVLRDPERVVRELLGWLGAPDRDDAVQAVQHDLRTQAAPQCDDELADEVEARAAARERSVEARAAARERTVEAREHNNEPHGKLCAELYQRIDQGRPLDRAFRQRLFRAHERLLPRIEAAEQEARDARRRERERARAASRQTRLRGGLSCP
jgi:hypothetical protein